MSGEKVAYVYESFPLGMRRINVDFDPRLSTKEKCVVGVSCHIFNSYEEDAVIDKIKNFLEKGYQVILGQDGYGKDRTLQKTLRNKLTPLLEAT